MKTRYLSACAAVALLCVAGAMGSEKPLVIADFEDGTPKPFKSGTVVKEHAAHGASSLKVEAKKWVGADKWSGLPEDWSRYDVVKMEIFNPSQKNIKMSIFIRDPMASRGYWAWHDRYTALSPGENTIQFAVADLWRGEILRRDIPGMLDTKKITLLSMNADGVWYLDHVRLESFPAAKVSVPGLRAFDVGKAGTPGFPGFTALTEKSAYSKAAGFGWTRSDFARRDDRIHPDNLFRDNLSCRNCELAVDVPDGKYRVHMQLEDPSYWELMQFYNRRTVKAEGATVVDETMGTKEFKRRYFLNQDAEDFPGDDPFEKYVETRHPWHVFEVEVADGQLNLAFRCADSYGNTLSALVLYPAEHKAAGDKFIDYVKALRRFDWAQRWKPVSKPPAEPRFSGRMAADARRDGFVLFRISPDVDVSYGHVPVDDEALAELAASAARGEYESCSFGLRPAKPLGKVEVTVSDLDGPGDAEIASADVDLRVGRYRFARHQGHQSGLYAVTERELRRFNRTGADELRSDRGMARRFWLTVRPAPDAAAGLYKGTVTVRAEKGGTRRVPLKLRVLPIELPEPDHLFSLYGIGVLPIAYFPKMKAERPAQTERVYRDLRAHGINYLKDSGARVQWQGGKAVITNAEDLARSFALRKRLGFREGPVSVGSRSGAAQLASAERIQGLPRQEYIRRWHKEITDVFRSRGWPHPSFCYGDEPNVPETLIALTRAHNNIHAVSPDIWTCIAYHTGNKESYELMKSLDVHHFKRFRPVGDFLMAKKHAKVLLVSNPGATRMSYGLWSWRAKQERKIDGTITYSYTGNHVDIYYGLDAREDEYNMAPPRIDGSFATRAAWERIREGIDDFRYAQALSKLTGPHAAAAKDLLAKAYELGGGKRSGDAAKAPALGAWRKKAQDLLARAGR